MRIVAGEFGGRSLLAPRGTKVRPTSDRVREAIFSALGDISGARAVDLFCGTGALGIEALSRGAAHLTLVDRDTRPALGNVHSLGINDRVTLVRDDAIRFLKSAPAREEDRFDLMLIDPPYRLADRVMADLDPLINSHLAPGGRVVIESSARAPMKLASLALVRERRYGGTLVCIHLAAEAGAEESS